VDFPEIYTKMAISNRPAFSIGERVTVTFPGAHRGKHGLVMDVVDHKGDFVFRYRVRLQDGDAATFFEFELTHSSSAPSGRDDRCR
jgi:hypothetical protein